jgi:hypothetical protein
VSDLPRRRSSTPPRVVACRRLCLCVARPSGVDDVAGVAISGLPARVEEPLFGRRAPRVGGALRRSARVHRGFRALRAPIVLRAPLLADAGRRALGLLDGRLLDERLRLAVQVPRLGCRRGGHGPQQCRGGDELLARSRGRIRVVDVKSALMRSRPFLPSSRARSPRAEASPAMEARSNRTVRYSSANLASSSCTWASCALMSAPLGGEEGGALAPAARRDPVPKAGGNSPSLAPATSAVFAGSLAMTTQHSRAGS